MKPRHYNRFKTKFLFALMLAGFVILFGRLIYVMVIRSDYYLIRAEQVEERERKIKALRGNIYDRNHTPLAVNQSVCTVSVIHNQITDAESVIKTLSDVLDMDEEKVRARVEKVSSIEKIKSNVPKALGDKIRSYKLNGVNVDEDYARYYPYGALASKVIGFTGGDNQGIIGLEVKYDEYLCGSEGRLLTKTDVRGVEVENEAEKRENPVPGYHLNTSIDYNIQKFAAQIAQKILKQKQAKGVSIILMNPQNGEIYALVDAPEFDLNEPYELTETYETERQEESEGEAAQASVSNDESYQDALNQMWRNGCINDTYEPGSTFKIVTSTAAFEENVISLTDSFSCPGFRVVEDRRIRCHKTAGHGAETFEQGFMNSCNPVFIDVGARVGTANMYKHFGRLGLFEKTGVDLPGESSSIMHKKENIGAVELATISFGQSFQITPMQLLRAVSAVINGGTLVTPHFGVSIENEAGQVVKTFDYEKKSGALSAQTSEMMKALLGKVVSEGTGKNAKVEGYDVGGKTATSQKLPRGSGKYIASFLGFSPVDEPQIIGLVMIDEPVGTYYGGTIAAPVMKEIYENVLPYLENRRALQ